MADKQLREEQIENLPASKIASGTFANARISESSVTQHQAALSITESQITDLGSYVTATKEEDQDYAGYDIKDIALATFRINDIGNSGTSFNLDWNDGAYQEVTMTDDCTCTFTAPSGPARVQLKLVQDATGSRTATWPASVLWPGGTAPTLSTAANAVDIISFYWDGTNYYGVASLDFQ